MMAKTGFKTSHRMGFFSRANASRPYLFCMTEFRKTPISMFCRTIYNR